MQSTIYKSCSFVTKQNLALNGDLIGDTLYKNIIIDLQKHRRHHGTVTLLHRNRLVYFISKDLSL